MKDHPNYNGCTFSLPCLSLSLSIVCAIFHSLPFGHTRKPPLIPHPPRDYRQFVRVFQIRLRLVWQRASVNTNMGEELARVVVLIRKFEPSKDRGRVEALERICEVGPSGTLSLFTDLRGDPLCRVRHSPFFLMLVRTFYSFFTILIISCYTNSTP